MRGSPPCEIEVGACAGWRLAVAGVALAALGAIAGWLAGEPQGQAIGARVAAGAVAIAVIAAAASLLRHRPVRLRWDGSGWQAGFMRGATRDDVPGELGVALDLGAFLLLVFRPDGARRWALSRWIPVGRTGLEGEWHVFRCAVHSPRAGAASSAAGSRLP